MLDYIRKRRTTVSFAKKLASVADLFFVNDAFFSTAHRAHASTEGVTKYFFEGCFYILNKS